ncbi:S-methyl-5-thioribose-1-phosphate isomerase, partial [Candidatus Micrarchaeota archaeon]|nr:S-methyl-5-thioribose-1-phosphate isomerase [Candidatus Micrarchaeota archaeon]
MDKKIETIIKNIKDLKIQGARNVAKAAVGAIATAAKDSKAKSVSKFYSEILAVAQILAAARPTEPMTRNALDEVSRALVAEKNDLRSVKEAKQMAVEVARGKLKKMDENAARLMSYGSQLIPEDSLVITHCHSSTVTGILRKAKKDGKKFEVICCETRPLFQGHKTAKELVEAGIKTTLIVDSAVNLFMRNANFCLVGADAITSRGDLINKVGTSMVAHIARFHDVSFYSAAELYKYSPLSLFGSREVIEERNTKEVWDNAPKKLA